VNPAEFCQTFRSEPVRPKTATPGCKTLRIDRVTHCQAKHGLYRKGITLAIKAVIGSGDLFTAEVCVRRLTKSGINGLALARGVIGNPWLFREVLALLAGQPKPEPPSLVEQREVLEEHFRLSATLYGERRAATMMRAFGVKYSLLHPYCEQVRQDFVRVKTAEDWNDVLKKWYI
jgi:tRNA-dihydrouridine synthase